MGGVTRTTEKLPGTPDRSTLAACAFGPPGPSPDRGKGEGDGEGVGGGAGEAAATAGTGATAGWSGETCSVSTRHPSGRTERPASSPPCCRTTVSQVCSGSVRRKLSSTQGVCRPEGPERQAGSSRPTQP